MMTPSAQRPKTLLDAKRLSRELRRTLLLDAAERLLAHRPFAAVGVRDVAKEAGMSAAGVYLYFRNRAELYGFLVIEFLARLRLPMEDGLRHARTLREGLEAVVRVLLSAYRLSPHLYALVMFEQRHALRAPDLSAEIAARIDEATRDAFAPLVSLAIRVTGPEAQRAIDFVAHLQMVVNGIFLQAYKVRGMRHTSWDLESHLAFGVAAAIESARLLERGWQPPLRAASDAPTPADKEG